MKLKQSQVAQYREELLEKQGSLCALCGQKIESDAVLDHCHETGHVRAVLHRNCNTLEGKIVNWVRRLGGDNPRWEILYNVMQYWESHTEERIQGNPLHPTHRTQEDKEIRALQKRIKVAKKESTKQKLRERIQEIKSANKC